MGEEYNVKALASKVLARDRSSLSRAITCIESRRAKDVLAAEELLEQLLPYSGRSLRIGITGIPGVGKSSCIEALGLRLLEKEPKARVAVLAIDPSSYRSRGSILADKVRMEKLSRHPRAYIRPSPSGMVAGGTSGSTEEAILICEAAGYSYIFVETVGVGQREIAVREVVDCVVVLLLAGTGDHWQGIKRGILEIADLILVHKSDGKYVSSVRAAVAQYRETMQLISSHTSGWKVPVLACSSKTGEGLDEMWKAVQAFFSFADKGYLIANRQKQRLTQLEYLIANRLIEAIQSLSSYKEATDIVEKGKSLPRKIANQLISTYLSSLK